MKTLQVDNIEIEGGTQAREFIDLEIVKDYKHVLEESNGEGLPPVDVYFDGATYWLSDGFHRWHAHKEAGLGTIQANVIKGTQRDAILAAVGANAAHGLKRSNADKRKAVTILLNDDEWKEKSNRWIADKAKVSDVFVGKVRDESTANVCSSRVGKDGKERKLPEPRKTRQDQIDEYFANRGDGPPPVKPKVHRADADLPEAYLDADGEPVPESLLPVWRKGTELGKIIADARSLKYVIGQLNDSEMSSQFTLAAYEQIQDVIDDLECSRPCKVLDGAWLAYGEVNE